jgi:hypothetical protein
MSNAVKVLLQMTSASLQLESTVYIRYFFTIRSRQLL